MATPKRPQGSIEHVFNRVLVASFLLHAAFFFLVMNVEPPPPPSQEEYATWLKKVTPPRVVEEAPPPVEAEKVLEKPKKEEEEKPGEVREERPRAAQKARPAAKPGEAARRAQVREKLSGAGILASIGAASEEGGLANVFESEAVVSKDLGAALSERGGVRVSGGTRIGKKGAVGGGAADIGDVGTGAGGKAGELTGRAGTVPKAFVKSSEAVVEQDDIDIKRGVQMALKRRERAIQQCYETALKSKPDLKGKVTIEWRIDTQGKVVPISGEQFIKVLQDTLRDQRVAECINDIIGRIRFPAAKGIVPIRKTFVFESG